VKIRKEEEKEETREASGDGGAKKSEHIL